MLATRFVSSSQVQADIVIGADANIALYDVAIRLAGGKRGVGIERFEVTTAETLGPDGVVYDLSETGQVTGYTFCCTATVYETGVGVTALGPGQAWALDPLGTVVLGRDAAFRAAAWTRQAAGSYQLELLPGAAGSTGGLVRTAERASDGTLIVAGSDAVPAGSRKNSGSVNRAAVWRRVGSTWVGPELYSTPPGLTGSTIRSINSSGQAAGVANQQAVGVIWESATTFTLLDGIPEAINPAGTIVVGLRSGVPVYWWRNVSTGAWTTTGVSLPSLGGTCQVDAGAQAINNAGIVVGQSCNSKGLGQATVWQLDLSGPVPTVVGAPQGLPGLGDKPAGTPLSLARGITETAPYVVAGTVNSKGKALWVRWLLLED